MKMFNEKVCEMPVRLRLPNFFAVTVLIVVMLLPSSSNSFDVGGDLNLKPTKYLEWSKNITYQSITEYNSRGMKPLYDITHKLMWFLIGAEDPIPEGK